MENIIIIIMGVSYGLMELIEKLKTLVGASFGTIFMYENENGQIADYRVNFGMNYGKAKEDDFKTICAANASELSAKLGIELPMIVNALADLRKSFDPSAPPSARSIAQTDAYIHVPEVKGLRILKSDLSIHFYCYGEVTKIHREGEYKQVNSRPETIVKNKVKKELNLKTNKFKNFKVPVDKMFGVKVKGDTFIVGA